MRSEYSEYSSRMIPCVLGKMAEVKRSLFGILLLLVLAGCGGGGTPSAQKTNVRVEAWTNPQGQRQQMVYVDWKNTGTTPIRFVVADLSFYNASGSMMGGFGKCVVYTAPAGDAGIAAGATYVEPQGEGYAIELPSGGPVASAQAEIKTVQEVAPSG